MILNQSGKTMNITNFSYQPKIQTNNPAFQGISMPRLFATPKTTVTLSTPAQLNKEAMEWLKDRLQNTPQESLQKAYNSCLNADNNISEQAINLFKKYIPEQKSFLGKMFNFSEPKRNLYQKFGLDFLSIMFEGSKNDDKNHTAENLNFLEVVLDKYNPLYSPKLWLDMIVKSKVKDGNVIKGASKLFDKLYDMNRGCSDDREYKRVIRELKHDKTELEQNFIVKNVLRGFGGKHFEDLLKIIEDAKGKDFEKILKAADEDLEHHESHNVRRAVYHSSINDFNARPYKIEANYENYIAMRPYIDDDGAVLVAKDKYDKFSPDVCELVRTLWDKMSIRKSFNFIDLVKNKDGTFNIEAAKYLKMVVKESSEATDFSDITFCLSFLKNKNGHLQYNHANALTKAWNRFRLDVTSYKAKDLFPDVIRGAKDKDGNYIPEILNELPALFDSGCSLVTPNILKISKFNDKFNKANFDKAVNILKNVGKSERKELSEFLLTCLDANNNLDTSKTKIFEDVKKCGIDNNIIKIATALQNPDKQFSSKGLDFVKELRKGSSSDIEDDMADILYACRDKSGFLNDNTMHVAKMLHSMNSDLRTSKLVKFVLNHNKEVSTDRVQVVTEILKSTKQGKLRSVDDLETILKYSTDRNNVLDLEVLKRLTELSARGERLLYLEDAIPAYRKLYKYEHVTSLSQLNLSQKRTLMQALRTYKNQITSSAFLKLMKSKILPINDSEYCSKMGRLSHSIGINTHRLPRITKENYYKAMDNLADRKQGFVHLDFNKATPVLKLTYSLNDFKQDVWKIVKDAHYSDRTKALDYFGFELKNSDGNIILTGYPNADKPDGNLASIKDKDIQRLISKLTPLVIKFTQSNAVSIQDHPNVAKNITEIVKAFPEFLTTIGKKQHGTHDFTLDVHTLKVLQEVFKNSEYEKLSDASKKHIQIAALLHDITKAEGHADFDHPRNSGFDAYYLLDKLGFSEKEKLKIYHIIRNHDWLAKYDFSDEKSKKIAFNLREGNAFKLCSMLTEADLKGVQKNNRFYDKHAAKLEKAKHTLKRYVYDLQSTSIHLPQTTIPKASELNKTSQFVTTINSDGIKNTVLWLNGCHDLEKAGFKSCKSVRDFNVLVHGLDSKNAASMFQALGLIDSNALLSTSYVIYSKGNYKAFRNEGFVLDVPDANTHVAFWRDFGSGYRKSVKDLLDTYLFCNSNKRNYIPDYLKQHLRMNDKEYIALQHKIEDMPLEKIEKIAPKVAKTYRDLYQDMEIGKRSFGRNYNEILVTNPKIQGIFCYNKKPENISSYLRKYAERNDIPIVVFG